MAPNDAALYRRRHRIENMFGRLKGWRRTRTRTRTRTRYDRCVQAFMSAIALAAAVIFWIGNGS